MARFRDGRRVERKEEIFCADCTKRIKFDSRIDEISKGKFKHHEDFECNRIIRSIPKHSLDLNKFRRFLQDTDNQQRLDLDSIRRNLNLKEIRANTYRIPSNFPVINRLFPDWELFAPEEMINKDGKLLIPGVHIALANMEGDWVNERLARLAILHDSLSTDRVQPSYVDDKIAERFRIPFPSDESLLSFKGSDEKHRQFIDMRQFPEYIAICSLSRRYSVGEAQCKTFIEICSRLANSYHIRTIAQNLIDNVEMYLQRHELAFYGYMTIHLKGARFGNPAFSEYVAENLSLRNSFMVGKNDYEN